MIFLRKIIVGKKTLTIISERVAINEEDTMYNRYPLHSKHLVNINNKKNKRIKMK